jgi:hypothetical protein
MNCAQCGVNLPVPQFRLWCRVDDADYEFCSKGCLRVWLGPDRFPEARSAAAASESPTPQDVVVCEHEFLRRIGEGLWRCAQCRAVIDVSEWERDR